MITDAQGHTVSDATPEAVRRYDEGVRAFNLGYGDAPGGLDAAIEAAPQCAMAHLAKAWLFALSNDPMVLGNARPLPNAPWRIAAPPRSPHRARRARRRSPG